VEEREVNVGLVLDDVFLGHTPLEQHPERPERLAEVGRVLGERGVLGDVVRVHPRPVKDDELGRVHTAGYLAEIERTVPGQSGWIDEDTYFSPGSWTAALAAAGASIDLTLDSVSGRLPRGLAAVRPPGHHALPERTMGFCLLNNVAVAAAAARAAGVPRVAIVDWDVHHGNGTQEAFRTDPSVLFVSTHQSPCYPGTGPSMYVGSGEGLGATVNLPLPPGSGDAEYAVAFDEVVAPVLRAFRPELILVSAGFDPFVDDPVAQMNVTTAGFARMARTVRRAADELCGGRMVCILEGGYDLAGLADGVHATLTTLMQPTVADDPPVDTEILRGARHNVEATKRALAPYYPGVWPQ
jgi:acetoin utilization deacetylase AcuC-like enzyme